MANFTIRFHRLAAREYQHAQAWYARRSPGVAQHFRDEVRRVIQRIETAPDQGSIYRGAYRWMRLHGLPYLIYYGPISPTDIVLYALAHASRRPGYWLRRTRP
jgi:plasmid stabilization system protein ParE